MGDRFKPESVIGMGQNMHVPYPKDQKLFFQLVNLGQELRNVHLLESGELDKFVASYPVDGDNVITCKINKNDWELTDQKIGRIWINDKQFFDCVPLVVWNFYIGGYQPAQKWLKDRYQKKLTYDDILHYQRIITALNETDRLMQEIDKIKIE